MLFKDISYLEPWLFLCSEEQDHLWHFERRQYEDQFCETILNLDQWFRSRSCLKDFLSRALVALVLSVVEPFMQFW